MSACQGDNGFGFTFAFYDHFCGWRAGSWAGSGVGLMLGLTGESGRG